MQRKIVTPVSADQPQRHAPVSVRTRIVSASAGPDLVRVVEDDARCLVGHVLRSASACYSKTASMPAFFSASARAFIQPSAKALSSDGPVAP